jgi:GNAT superfamily N-acetyltransferase
VHVSDLYRSLTMTVCVSRIVPMLLHHVPMVAKVHLESFPGFFLSFLGLRFLQHYYSGICSDPEGIKFVCLSNAEVPIGFVVGASNPRGFYKRLLKRDWLKFSLASAPAIIKHPIAIKRISRGLLHPAGNPVGADVAGLFSIGVHPELQGTGAGQLLVQVFLQETRTRGCKRVFLTTDRDNNEVVNTFYQKLGFRIERQYVTPEGRCMNEYWIDLIHRDTEHA